MDTNCTNNPYAGGIEPPCAAFLNDTVPIVKDGKVIFRNLNRAYCFISTTPKTAPSIIGEELLNPNTLNYMPFTSTNLQISIPTFVIGLYINQVQRGVIKYDNNADIHSEKAADDFIHKMLNTQPPVTMEYAPKLSFIYSNGSAILPLISTSWEITPLNYYILFVLNRLENDPGLLFGNNSYITRDIINLDLAALNLEIKL